MPHPLLRCVALPSSRAEFLRRGGAAVSAAMVQRAVSVCFARVRAMQRQNPSRHDRLATSNASTAGQGQLFRWPKTKMVKTRTKTPPADRQKNQEGTHRKEDRAPARRRSGLLARTTLEGTRATTTSRRRIRRRRRRGRQVKPKKARIEEGHPQVVRRRSGLSEAPRAPDRGRRVPPQPKRRKIHTPL